MPAQHHTRPLTTALLIASLVIPGPLSGCVSTSLYKPQRSENQRDAGSVHIAVFSVHTWRSMVEKLAPHIDLTMQEAIAAVIRDSRRMVSDSSTGIGASAGYSNTDGTTPVDVDTGLPVVGGPPAIPALPTYPYEGRSPSERPDAMLEYNAALSLYQSVVMMTEYLRAVPIPPGHRAYVVQLQVTLLPSRRHSPYDVEARIGFFSPQSELAGESQSITSAGSILPPSQGTNVGRMRAGDMLAATDQGPTVLPLFSTDNLEASFNANSSKDLLSLSALYSGAGGGLAKGLGFDAFSSQAQSQVYGRDLNALLTVGKGSENSIVVRMGAMQETTADLALIPRNHLITVFLTVPEEAPSDIEVSLVTEFRDTTTGKVLRGTTDQEINDLYGAILEDYDLDGGNDLVESLRLASQQNRPHEFIDILVRAVGPNHSALGYANALWMDLVNLTAGSQYAGTRSPLPGHGPQSAALSDYFHQQTLILQDDGFTNSIVTLSGITLLENLRPEALLTIETDLGDVKRMGRWVQPPAGEIPGELTFQFESPAMMDLVREDGTVGPISLKLRLKDGVDYDFEDLLYRSTGGVLN
jgi:hypothetical protein